MEVHVLFASARSVTLSLEDGGRYYTRQPLDIYVNGALALTTDKVITNVFGLKPGEKYTFTIVPEGKGLEEVLGEAEVTTSLEGATLNVRDFGAKGDGVSDDTLFLQAAIACCPADGRVLIPAGDYAFRFLTLKSDLTICLEKGARLLAFTDADALPLLPGMVQTYDEKGEYNLASWEGNPLPCYMSLIYGIGAKNVFLYGEGVIDGCAGPDNWWSKRFVKKLPGRPRLLFLNHCENVTVQGLTFTNSPSWNLHPYFSKDIAFYGTQVLNPAISPNTDGLDPESCENVKAIGMRFSLGDDCIAVKAGKIYMAKTYHVPCKNMEVRQCLLANGHGAVTIGSEMAGGVIDLTVKDCLFSHTDRGLRIKTRRGRGEEAVVEGILFENIEMDHVLTPIVVNCFYQCDPDGKTSYVQSRGVYPVDERTPQVRSLTFKHLTCNNCHVQAAYIEGLPEKKIEEVVLEDVHFSFAEDATEGIPAMSVGVEARKQGGLFAKNVKKLRLKNVTVEGAEGPKLLLGKEEEQGENTVEQEKNKTKKKKNNNLGADDVRKERGDGRCSEGFLAMIIRCGGPLTGWARFGC